MKEDTFAELEMVWIDWMGEKMTEEEKKALEDEEEYDMDDIGEATEDIAEDVEHTKETTSSIDKKTSWLIALWMIDKVILVAMFYFIR